MNCSLLFPSSTIFPDSNLIDQIRQSFLDLGDEKQEEVKALFNEALSYLEQDIDNELADELLSFILHCFYHYEADLFPIFNEIMINKKYNCYHIIIWIVAIQYMVQYYNLIPDENQRLFIEKITNQIQLSIQNSDKTLILFKQEIPNRFKLDIILNTVLLSNLNDLIVSDLCTFVVKKQNQNFCNCNKIKINLLLDKIMNEGLIDIILIPIFSNCALLSTLSSETFLKLLTKLSNELFIQFFTSIEFFFVETHELNQQIIIFLLQKCHELKLKLKSVEKIFNFLSYNEITSEIINYLKEYDFLLPIEAINAFIDLHDRDFLIKIIPDFKYLPINLQNYSLLESNDINFYNRVFVTTEIESNLFTTSEFYNHMFKVLSDQYDKCSTKVIENLSKICQKSITKENFNKTINDMIFNIYPPTPKQIEFLKLFINHFDLDHKNLFSDINNMKLLINEIVKRREIPFYSFFEIIDSDSIIEVIKKLAILNKNKNPLYNYILKFSRKTKKYGEHPINLVISTQYNSNDNQYFNDFINNNDYSLLNKLDEESFSIAVNALIFSEYINSKVLGLTKETIIPFYAIVLTNWIRNSSQSSQLFSSKDVQSLFLESFRSMLNSDNSIIISSINSILSNIEQNVPLFISNHIIVQMVEILLEHIMKNEHYIDINILLSFIIYNSKYFKNIKLNLNDICLYIIQHLHETNYEPIYYQINFNYLSNTKNLISFIVSIIENEQSSQLDVFNTMYFLEFICNNFPKIQIDNTKNLEKLINDQKYDTNMILGDFNTKFVTSNSFQKLFTGQLLSDNKIKKTDTIIERDVIQILSPILSNKDIEKNDNLLGNLFKQMMKNNKIALEYIKIIFQKISIKEDVDRDELYSIYSNDYYDYNNLFNNSDNLYTFFHQKKSNYIRTDFEISIIQYLFDSIKNKPGNYQAFYCLKSIASSFPFLFELNTNQLFEAVLPELGNFSLLFENNNDKEREEKVKTAISAFSFLISTLHSTAVIDELIFLLLNNIESYDASSIYCIIFIIYSILKENKINSIMIHILADYDFLSKITNLMQKKIPDGIFAKNYYYLISLLLKECYAFLIKLGPRNFIPLSERVIQRNTFNYAFDNLPTILPYKIDQIQKELFIDVPRNDVNTNILQFMEDINDDIPFWITSKSIIKQNSEKNYGTFFTFYKNFIEYKKLLGTSLKSTNIDLNGYKRCEFQQKILISNLIDKSISSIQRDKVFYTINDLISTIVQYNDNDTFSYVLSLYEHKLDEIIEKEIEGIDILDMLYNFIVQLLVLSKYINFRKLCPKSLISKLILICLEPEYRLNEQIIYNLSGILTVFDYGNLPIRATHLICFMLNKNKTDEFISRCVDLYQKYNIDDLKHMKYIKKIFFEEIQKENHSPDLIFKLLNNFISNPVTYHIELIKLLDKLLSNNSIKDNYDIIIQLLKVVTPNLTEDDVVNIIGQIDEMPIPQSIQESDQDVWDLFEKHRSLIIDIIENNEENIPFNLFAYFPELFSTSMKYEYFRIKMNQIYDPSETVHLYIDPDHILDSAFNQLYNLDNNRLKNNIQITYIGNKGSDYGGLKRDFFIKLSRELFNPDYGLFVQSSSMSYYPNYLSYVNPDHLKYFKFAGMIIAKALMQGENLEAHLSTFLLRRIINDKTLYEDLKEMDEEKYNSLQWIIQNDVSNIDLNFEVVIKEYDVPKVIPLKENGSNIELLQENKSEYVNLISDFHLRKVIEEQIKAFIDGFDLIIPFGSLKIFIPNELDLLICGIQEIDVEDMKMNTQFISPFNINSPYINLFFDSISKWDQENLRKLLMFITGSSRVPINGFKTYKDNGNPITIQKGDNKNRLPIARTCSYTLILPCYETEEELNSKLLLAINETTFQLV